MTGATYWQQRAEENALRVYRYGDRKALLVTRWFSRARREIQKTIDQFHRRYARAEQISPADAKAVLTDRRAFSMTLEQYRALAAQSPLDPVLQARLRRVSFARSVSREEFLLMQLELLESKLYMEYAGETSKSVTEIFEDSYYKTLFDQQQYIGFGSAFNRLSTHQIEAATTTVWRGKNYSERIWGDQRQRLAHELNRIVTTGFLEGKANGQMTAELRRAMDTGAYNARRLIRTECAQVASRASLLAYAENGTPQFKFLATLDFKTSEICRGMDGKIFDTADGKVGVNLPPLHPFCRSTTVPHVSDAEFDSENTRAARNADGESYKVPADMTYSDWHKKYVESDPTALLTERKYKHGGADAKQFEQYRALLGDDAPKSLAALQNIKYTDADGWIDLQAFARYKRYYPDSDRAYYEINREIQALRELGIVGRAIGIAVSPRAVKIESYEKHALNRMFERGFGTEDAARFIKSALVEFRQFQGTRSAFYSRDGVSVVLRSRGAMITGWDKTDFNDGMDPIWEVLKKHGKG